MRVLMLSRDRSGLDPSSATSKRWQMLRDAGVELEVIVASFGSFWNAYRRARRLAKNVDLVTAQDPFELGLIAWLATRGTRTPFEIQDHGGFFDGEDADEPLWFLRKRLARFAARRADRIRTVSPMGPIGSYFLPIAADPKFSQLARRPEPDLIVTVSRLVSVKRVDLLLRAFSILKRSRPSARLVIVGDGPLRSSLASLAAQLGIASSVEFVGAQDPSPWLARASLFVSLSAHEGWGIASVEAALAGVPVVMTKTGCAEWLAERGAATVVSRQETDPTRLAQAIQDALRNPVRPSKPLECLTPQETAQRQVAEWQRVSLRKPSLLVVTQIVNADDSNLGFFHRWLELLAEQTERLTVICLFEGRHHLPPNVEVLSLGKEKLVSRAAYLIRFYRFILSRRRRYDGVFVHMNPIYVVLGGPVWKLLGKRVCLWYVHKSVEWKLRIAEMWADGIFTASKESFRLPSKKVRIVGHGIDTDFFTPSTTAPPDGLRLLTVGRITPSKDPTTLIAAVAELKKLGIEATLDIVGAPITSEDVGYETELRRFAAELHLGDSVRFVGPATYVELPNLYRSHNVFVHASRTGSIDKVVLEALVCGLNVYSSSEAFAHGFDVVVTTYPAGDARALADRIATDARNGKIGYTSDAVALIRRRYDLRTLIGTLVEYFA